jgi:tetratricopeptide (TPR) repeat protein
MKRNIILCFCFTLAVIFLFAPLTGAAFHRAAAGEIIENVELPALSGGNQPLLTDAAVNVFVFFKPDHEHSQTTLAILKELAQEFADKPVHWAAVVSDSFEPADIEAEVKTLGFTLPVLIDTGDKLYGRLAVAMTPNIGITDKQHKLIVDLPFNKVNYASVIRGYIQHELQEINDEELQSIINPPRATMGGNGEVAHRHLKYAEKLFRAGLYDKALENVQTSLEKDPNLANAHALRGQILSAQGQRDEAMKAFNAALELDPSNETALNGRNDLLNNPNHAQ